MGAAGSPGAGRDILRGVGETRVDAARDRHDATGRRLARRDGGDDRRTASGVAEALNEALLAFCAGGLVIFGLLTMSGELTSVSYTGLFVGYAAIAAVIPELGVIVEFLILRLTVQTHLPSMATAILLVVGAVRLLACTTCLLDNSGLVARGWLSGPDWRTSRTRPGSAT